MILTNYMMMQIKFEAETRRTKIWNEKKSSIRLKNDQIYDHLNMTGQIKTLIV